MKSCVKAFNVDTAAFKDINPQGPVHFLVIPKDKNGLNRLSSATEEHVPLLGKPIFAFPTHPLLHN